MKIKAKLLKKTAKFPEYQTDEAAGADVFACLPGMGETVEPGVTKLVPTGVSVELPKGYELQVRSRSSRVLHDGLVVANAPGTIDSDYRGEIFVILRNIGDRTVALTNGERIAQVVLSKVATAEFVPIDTLAETKRGTDGFGSTGKK